VDEVPVSVAMAASILSPILVGGIGWLIRLAFRQFGDKLSELVAELSKVRDDVDAQGNRITALEARQSQPYRKPRR
jgi:hypothetical protein